MPGTGTEVGAVTLCTALWRRVSGHTFQVRARPRAGAVTPTLAGSLPFAAQPHAVGMQGEGWAPGRPLLIEGPTPVRRGFVTTHGRPGTYRTHTAGSEDSCTRSSEVCVGRSRAARHLCVCGGWPGGDTEAALLHRLRWWDLVIGRCRGLTGKNVMSGKPRRAKEEGPVCVRESDGLCDEVAFEPRPSLR